MITCPRRYIIVTACVVTQYIPYDYTSIVVSPIPRIRNADLAAGRGWYCNPYRASPELYIPGKTKSKSRLLMGLAPRSPGHRQPRYWYWKTSMVLSSLATNIKIERFRCEKANPSIKKNIQDADFLPIAGIAFFNGCNVTCILRNVLYVPLWYYLITDNSVWWLKITWCLFGTRVSAAFMITLASRCVLGELAICQN